MNGDANQYGQKINAEEIERVLVALNVASTPDLVQNIIGKFEWNQMSSDADSVRTCVEGRFEDIKNILREILVFDGIIDEPGDCPVCHRSGWIRAEKHQQCVKMIYADAKGLCSICKIRPASTIRYFTPMCTDCDRHQEHLDNLYD